MNNFIILLSNSALLILIYMNLAQGRLKLEVIIDEPVKKCINFNQINGVINFEGLELVQLAEDKFSMNGIIQIKDDIEGGIALQITAQKYERGMWIDSFINHYIPNICDEIGRSDHQHWRDVFEMMVNEKKCPFIKKDVVFDDFEVLIPLNDDNNMPASIIGTYRAELRFRNKRNDIGCGIIEFEIEHA